MSNQEDRQQQEYEFVMEGITTRMQIALEKMSESNRLMAENNRRQGKVMIVVLIIVMLGFIVNNIIMINHVNNIRNEVSAYEAVSEQRQGAND